MRKGAKQSNKYKYLDVLLFILFGCTVLLVNKMVSAVYPVEVLSRSAISPRSIKGYVLTDLVGGDLNTMSLIQKSAQGIDRKIVFEQMPATQSQDIMNYIADEEQEIEFIMGGTFDGKEIYKLQKSGMIIPLNKLIAEHAPNIQKLIDQDPFFKESITHGDGNIYTLPKYYEMRPYNVNQYLFINAEWLEYLGLEMPTTTEDFYEVLKAFKTQDPNKNKRDDEVPFSFIGGKNSTAAGDFLGAFGVLESKEYIMKKDGEYIFVPTQEGYKEGVSYLSRLYQEGLLDPEIFTHDNNRYFLKGRQEEVTLGAFISYTAQDMVGEERAEVYTPLLPLEGSQGHRMWGNKGERCIEKNQFMITSTSDQPEKIIQWIDQFFDPNQAFMYQWGEHNQEGEGVEEVMKRSWMERLKTAPGLYGPGYIPKEIYEEEGDNPAQRWFEKLYKLYTPYFHQQTLCLDKATPEEMDRIVELYAQIDKYIREMKIRWLPGTRNIEKEWKSYTEALKNMGAGEYLALYEAIDRRCDHDKERCE
ncbi:MAG: hypothetical protein ACRCWY_10285 [Cellulosilyticaceae bacterium]